MRDVFNSEFFSINCKNASHFNPYRDRLVLILFVISLRIIFIYSKSTSTNPHTDMYS